MQILCTTSQAETLLKARSLAPYDRKKAKRVVMQQIHEMHDLPSKPAIVLFVENPNNPLYRVIRNKQTKLPLDDGRPEPKAKAPAVATPVADKAKAKAAADKAKAKAVADKAKAKAAADKAKAKAAADKAKAAADKAKAAPKASKAPAKVVEQPVKAVVAPKARKVAKAA